MTDERLRTLFHTTFCKLHPSAAQAAAPRRRVFRPNVLAAMLVFAFCGALGVGAAARYGGQWPSLFGYTYTEVEPQEGADRQFVTEPYSSSDLAMPEGEVTAFVELDSPFTLPEGTASTAGLILMEDGRVYLRRDGQEDERIDALFSEENTPYPYTDKGLEPREGVYLGCCRFTYERLGESVPVTVYRLRDAGGNLGYVACHDNEGCYLYDYDRFDSRCFAYFRALYVTPDENWLQNLDSNPDLN